MAFNFLKNLDADDIFISYSREDGSAYLTGLDAALSERGVACFTDKRGTDAGQLPPETLYRKVRACKTLVLLATPGALAKPENITPELENFAQANGTARIICVSFDGGRAFADFPRSWQPFVLGKAREREDPNAMTSGAPSEPVVVAVAWASDYMKSKDRLHKYRTRAIGVLAVLVVAIAAAALLAPGHRIPVSHRRDALTGAR